MYSHRQRSPSPLNRIPPISYKFIHFLQFSLNLEIPLFSFNLGFLGLIYVFLFPLCLHIIHILDAPDYGCIYEGFTGSTRLHLQSNERPVWAKRNYSLLKNRKKSATKQLWDFYQTLNYSVQNFRKILHTGLQINIIHLLNWIAVTKQIDCRALTESFLRKTIQPCRNAYRSCQQLHAVKKSKTRTVHLWKSTLGWKQLAKVSFLLTQRPRLQQPI